MEMLFGAGRSIKELLMILIAGWVVRMGLNIVEGAQGSLRSAGQLDYNYYG